MKLRADALFCLLILASVVATTAGSQVPAPAVDVSKWQTYRNAEYGFEVRYPEAWTVQSTRGNGATIVHLRSRLPDESGVYVWMGIQPGQNPKRLSIEDFVAAQFRLLKDRPPSTGRVTIGGRAAVFVENTTQFGVERDTFILLRQTDLVTLGYTHRPRFDAIFDAIVSSFRSRSSG